MKSKLKLKPKIKLKLVLGVLVWALTLSVIGRSSNAAVPSVEYGPANITPAPHAWPIAPPLNQAEAECVGFAFAGLFRAGPNPPDKLTGETIYAWSKLVDPWPGQPGTNIVSAASELVRRGYLQSASLTTDTTSAEAWIASVGPVVVASGWTDDMMDPVGPTEITPGSGPVVGNHAFMCYGEIGTLFECENSWGFGYRDGGSFTISAASLTKLGATFVLPVK